MGRRAGGTAVAAMAAAGGDVQAGQWGQDQRLGNEAIVFNRINFRAVEAEEKYIKVRISYAQNSCDRRAN